MVVCQGVMPAVDISTPTSSPCTLPEDQFGPASEEHLWYAQTIDSNVDAEPFDVKWYLLEMCVSKVGAVPDLICPHLFTGFREPGD